MLYERRNLAEIQAHNIILEFTGSGRVIEIGQVKYLNNILEQHHGFIKRITRSMMGLQAFRSAAALFAGIKAAQIILKGRCCQGSQMPSKSMLSLQGNYPR